MLCVCRCHACVQHVASSEALRVQPCHFAAGDTKEKLLLARSCHSSPTSTHSGQAKGGTRRGVGWGVGGRGGQGVGG